MTGKLNNRQAPRCSMPGSPSKAIIAAGELGADGFCPTPLTGGRLEYLGEENGDEA